MFWVFSAGPLHPGLGTLETSEQATTAGFSETLRGPRAAQYSRNGTQQNLQVQPQRPFVYVLQVQFHPLFEWNLAASLDLPKARDTWLYAKSPALPVFVEAFIIPHRQRTGPHQTHIPQENI